MKARTFILLCLCALTLAATSEPSDPPTTAEQIELRGKLDTNASFDDVEAYVDGHYVYVIFHRDFGYVSVTLYNPTGLTIYNNVVNTAVQQQVVIPVSGFSEGTYTLVLENVTGYADGDFEVED